MPSTQQRVLQATSAIVITYILARALIYRLVGPLHTTSDWLMRDAWVTIPRAAGFATCLLVASRSGGYRAWGWHIRVSPNSIPILAGAVFGYALQFTALTPFAVFTMSEKVFGWLTTLAVAAFEETAFRGLLFPSLVPAYGPRLSAIISSAGFAVYHVQAVSFHDWPLIFCWGVITCTAFWRGTGLPWLILAHEIVDGSWFHFASNYPVRHFSLLVMSLASFSASTIVALCDLPSRGAEKTSLPAKA